MTDTHVQVAPAPARNFVLVHGAWHGGWCWRRVADRLEQHGHRVLAPTLTGLCDRSHLLTPAIDLDTHATDIVNLVRWEQLADIVLVGHSYGGMVVTAVAESIEPSIASLVMLDAFYPRAGNSLLDIASPRAREMVTTAIAGGHTTVAPIPAAVFNANAADRAWIDAQCTPQPVATMTSKVSAAAVVARERVGRKTYIRATGYASPPFDAALAQARTNPAWRTYEVPCGHDVMLDMPERLVEILLEVA